MLSIQTPNMKLLHTEFLKTLYTWILKYALNLNNIIVAGDFNVCSFPEDRFPLSKFCDKSVIQFKELLRNCRLIDSWFYKYASTNENDLTY